MKTSLFLIKLQVNFAENFQNRSFAELFLVAAPVRTMKYRRKL